MSVCTYIHTQITSVLGFSRGTESIVLYIRMLYTPAYRAYCILYINTIYYSILYVGHTYTYTIYTICIDINACRDLL